MDEKHQLKRKKPFELSEKNCEQIKRRRETSTERGVDCGEEEKEEEKEEVAERVPVEDKAEGSFNFDVFISFRGEDTRNGFTSHLHKELKNRGIKTFIDSEDLEKGEKISDLFKYMEGSKIFVPVFSKNYAGSKWCLREIAKMVEIKNREGGRKPIIPIFYHVEPSDIEHCTKSLGEALQMHERDKELGGVQINAWKAALTEAANISGYSPSDADGNEAKLITLIGKDVSTRLCKVPFTIQPIGIGHCTDDLEEMLDRDRDGVCMIGICGMGGIGKTTLAMALYNELFDKFEHSFFLKGIREEDQKKIHDLQARFMEKVLRETMIIGKVEEGVSLIKGRLQSMKVLLVLDDVDDKKQLEAFTPNRREKEKWFRAGSKIIVTTRDKKVLLEHGLQEDDIYFPKELNKEDSLQLFCDHAFFIDQPSVGFEEVSREVVEVAQGLPLALKEFGTLFGTLNTNQEWEERLEILKSHQHEEVFERLKISYYGLCHREKNVFLDIACFFIRTMKKYPVYMWEACKYFPKATLKALKHKSLIKINEEDMFEMHDQIRDMGKMILKQESNPDLLKYSRLWSHDQVSEVLNDGQLRRCVQIIDFKEVSDEQIRMSWNDIRTMPNLRMIIGANRNHFFEDQEEIIRLPSKIRWFEWKYCPCETLTFHNKQKHDQLRILDLQCGVFRYFRSHRVEFPNLKVLDLSGCENLIRAPDFTYLPSLEELTLDYCRSLAEMDESIRQLKKPVKLSTMGCNYVRNYN